MTIENCPQCSSKLSPPLKSSGRQICTCCGWTDKKRTRNESVNQTSNRRNTTNSTVDYRDKSNNILTAGELFEIAKAQQNVLWLFLLGLVLQLISPALVLVSGIVQVYFVYNLAVATKTKFPILYCLFMFVPILSLLTLLSLTGDATSILKKNGIRVGLMGARARDLSKLEQEI